jgi:hypothetical protein
MFVFKQLFMLFKVCCSIAWCRQQRPNLELKNRPKFLPVGLSLSMHKSFTHKHWIRLKSPFGEQEKGFAALALEKLILCCLARFLKAI